MARTYSYYRNTFEITWADDSTETVTTETSHNPDSLPRYGDHLRVEEFDHAYVRQGVIFRWKVAVRGSFEQVRTLNFEHIKSIDNVNSEEVEVEV